MRYLFINVIEVDVFSTPLEIVDKFALAVAFLKDKGVLEKFTKLFNNVHMRIVRNSARKFPQFPFLTC